MQRVGVLFRPFFEISSFSIPFFFLKGKLHQLPILSAPSSSLWTTTSCTASKCSTPLYGPILLSLPGFHHFRMRIIIIIMNLADKVAVNNYYGGLEIAKHTTNIFFANGSQDPWQWAAVRPPAPNSDNIAAITQCSNCGHCCDLGGCPGGTYLFRSSSARLMTTCRLRKSKCSRQHSLSHSNLLEPRHQRTFDSC